MRFQVRIWCNDCDGDEAGCFDGVAVVLSKAQATEGPVTADDYDVAAEFETREVAEAAARRFVGDAPRGFEVFNPEQRMTKKCPRCSVTNVYAEGDENPTCCECRKPLVSS